MTKDLLLGFLLGISAGWIAFLFLAVLLSVLKGRKK